MRKHAFKTVEEDPRQNSKKKTKERVSEFTSAQDWSTKRMAMHEEKHAAMMACQQQCVAFETK